MDHIRLPGIISAIREFGNPLSGGYPSGGRQREGDPILFRRGGETKEDRLVAGASLLGRALRSYDSL